MAPITARTSSEFLAIFLMLVIGGSSAQSPLQRLGAEMLGLALLIGPMLRVRWRALYDDDRWAAWLGLGLGGLFVMQLVPLPASLWTHFGGRALFAAGDGLMFGYPLARPLSLEPDETVSSAVFLVPALAIWLRGRIDSAFLERWILVFLAFLAASFALAVVQVMAAPGEWHLYNNSHSDLPTGFFANRNHQSIAMDCGIAMAAGLQRLWMARAARLHARLPEAWRWLFGAAAVVGTMGALLTGSRTGSGLLPLALLGGGAIVYGDSFAARLTPARARLVGVAAVVGLGLIVLAVTRMQPGGQLGMVFSRSYTADDARYAFWPVVAQMIGKYAPWGTGLGSFRHVFEIDEPTRLLSPLWLNHAHNDWLEFLLETGLAGLVLIVAFVGWWGVRLRGARVAGLAQAPLAHAGALVVVLLLAHSVFDYPLRTVALASCLAGAMAMLSHRGDAAEGRA